LLFKCLKINAIAIVHTLLMLEVDIFEIFVDIFVVIIIYY